MAASLDRVQLVGLGILVVGFVAFAAGVLGLYLYGHPPWAELLVVLGGLVGYVTSPVVMIRDLLLRAVGA